jgi:D-alanyl-D-alanine carboxypeptidase/D-alanyl-D-alanine-endopeptidase (penicillin-binding protein 4)
VSSGAGGRRPEPRRWGAWARGQRPETRRRLAFGLTLIFALTSACAAHTASPAPGPRPPVSGTRSLASDLTAIFDAPLLARAEWAVLVRSLETGQTLYARNAGKLVMPASNMKIVTLAAAAERLGWDYRFETTAVSDAAIVDGVLDGDLVIVGGGDPSINPRHDRDAKIFEDLALQLRWAGVRAIGGRVVGDDNAFDDREIGAGWAWDYLGAGYAAPVNALAYHENLVELRLLPGPAVGAPARIEPEMFDWPGACGGPGGPERSALYGLTIVSKATTAEAKTAPTIDLWRERRSLTLEISGAIAVDSDPIRRTASVENPTLFFVRAFREWLISHGIDVQGEAADIDDLAPVAPAARVAPAAPVRVLARMQSPPLWEIATVLMKISQNLYAEMLFKTLGRFAGTTGATGARTAVSDVLTAWRIPSDSYVLADGSGLSRYNYVTPEMLVTILTRMQTDPRHRDRFEATLPIAGVDGTIASRMRGTRAEGNARAKSGSIANVRSLSGYVRTRDGERLVFSIVANHFTLPAATVDYVTDLAVEALANFTRNPRQRQP